MSNDTHFENEAELVACFCRCIDPAKWNTNPEHAPKWTVYHETAGWDLLLVDPTGFQVGIEAKMTLNAKVLEQALSGLHSGWDQGPDYRAVLVPDTSRALQQHLTVIAVNLGITIIRQRGAEYPHFWPDLPDERSHYRMEDWWNWCPVERCKLPDYVPDVVGGKPSPVTLTVWKVAAMKLMVLLDRRGFVTRADMKMLKLSESRWTQAGMGFLDPSPRGYVRGDSTPDLRAQHPGNYAQIEADYEVWGKPWIEFDKP